MNAKVVQYLFLTSGLMLAILLSACQSTVLSAPPVAPVTEGSQPATEGPQLATARVNAQLSNQSGRAIVSARGNHFVVDSVPPLEGPNEELNPLDMMLSALATCGIFVAEKDRPGTGRASERRHGHGGG